ncbi:MAG: nucleoside triphosphate pyrophosphohydrolase [Aquificae bacterium]|nr:nucleoside triphosphate pyrophosphohydrolase [Aquificota bacterium]
MAEEGRAFEELLKVMERLRRDCPWDREQTHESLKKYLIEEAYELLDAIDERDDRKLKEELGDLLLQVVFHAQIAKERDAFGVKEVIDELINKLIERHPHVFGSAKPEEALKNWEKRKLEKRESVLEGIPKHLPALMRSQKIQEKLAQAGFTFPSDEELFSKIEEELKELKQALKRKNPKELKHELGDLLTALVELARRLGLDAEETLQEANDRLIRRFSFVERKLKEQGRKPSEVSLEELEALWREAKKSE